MPFLTSDSKFKKIKERCCDMSLLDMFRKKIVTSIYKDLKEKKDFIDVDDKISLGVLMWVVAQADDRFLPQEEKKIEDVLKDMAKMEGEALATVMASVKLAAEQRIDLHTFTSEVSKDLSYPKKVFIIENLFRVACIDDDLDQEEHEIIRKISGLFGVDHKDFIDSKIRVKKECGMDTVE